MTTIHVYKNSNGGKTEFVHSDMVDGPIEDYAELRQEILEIKGMRRLYIYHDGVTLQIPKPTLKMNFKKYRRTQIAEMRPVTDADIKAFKSDKNLHSLRDTEFRVSISDADKANGSPKIGDMIARNPKNHEDQWLVSKQYFEDNFEKL
jgi:hypothetical protein